MGQSHSQPRVSGSGSSYKRLTRVRKWKLLASYTGDWLLTIGVAALFLALDNVHGFRRRFSLNDETIQFPYTANERVSNIMLGVYSLAIPFGLMPLINLISIRSWWDLHNAELGLILSLALTGAITNILKITTGRPRPDLIDRCAPRAGVTNPPVFGLVDDSICTQTDPNTMKDGWRSFASGHSSLSFAGLGFLTLYLAGKLHLFDHRGHTAKSWLAVLPLFGATVIAITRTMDYRHHYQDVFVGMVVGLVVAYFSYRQYYPSLEHPLCHRPYAPRFAPIEPPPSQQGGDPVPTDNTAPEAQQYPGKGKGKDIEAQATEGQEGGMDSELAGTLPRNKPPPLERVWSEGAK
ncbi:acid phosphatase/Vanadium-dependent haloperoxidase [Serendipita vermifera]|nr:acid phosphatase/Vanadium-dependent haloperoxidase [Serendipita vermifera]